MDFKEQSKILKKVLGLQNEPLAISFTNENISTGRYEKTSICKALKLAAEGECFIIDDEMSTCPGGSRYCGFSGEITGDKKRRLQNFLTKGEKLTNSIVSFERMMKLSVAPPTGLADRIVMCPLEKADIKPDMILFLCNGEQACRIISLDTYWDGLNPEGQLIGALCHTTISYTIMTGNTNVSMGDRTARNHQQFEPDIVFVSIPYERLYNLIAAIPECSAGEAALDIPKEFRND